MSITLPRGLAPPTDGSVTLPETVDFHRKYNPNVPIYMFSGEGSSHITEITHLEFGRACDRVAHLLRPGRRGPEREVVAIIALSDNLLYLAVIIGIMRAGLIVCLFILLSLCHLPACFVLAISDISP
jgi:acyl-CoA synthetase (AMP-forming)/AMP-acid ligase II